MPCGDPFGGGDCRRNGGDVRHVVLDGVLTIVGIVVGTQLARRRVDDELDFSVLHRIHNIWPAFVRFENGFGFDAILF